METTSQFAKTEQSEGNGGKDSPPNEAAVEYRVDNEAILKGMQPADRKAYLSCYYAETMVEKHRQEGLCVLFQSVERYKSLVNKHLCVVYADSRIGDCVSDFF